MLAARVKRSEFQTVSTTITGGNMNITLSMANLTPIVSLIAGILILIMPRLLNYIIAFYLIIIGLAGLLK